MELIVFDLDGTLLDRNSTSLLPSDRAEKPTSASAWLPLGASLALLGRVEEARAAWKNAGAHVSRERMRHSARFTGAGLEVLSEGLRLAGWDGTLG